MYLISLRTILQEDDRNGSHLKKLRHRNGRQAGVRLFSRSISIRRTSRFVYSLEPDDFLWELCNVALIIANRDFQLIRICSSMLPSYDIYFAE